VAIALSPNKPSKKQNKTKSPQTEQNGEKKIKIFHR
jgi:hypothetical protein